MQQGGGGLPEGAVPVTVVEVQEVPGEGSKPEHKEEKKRGTRSICESYSIIQQFPKAFILLFITLVVVWLF